MHTHDRSNLIPARRGGFTLAEMIVAVGAVALLSVGIGQIFKSVGKLVGAGAAIAETDQAARAIERQLRDDFAAASRLRAEESFLAIRNRRIGDTNGNRSLDGGETAIYLSKDDREADIRAGVSPYTVGSRAVTRRLDDIVLLGFTGEYVTAQVSPLSGSNAASAVSARIYYGHGLRPSPDTTFDPANPPVDSNVPQRRWVADGDFGERAGADNRFDPTALHNGGKTAGRNEYAGDWLLLRQPLLLFGGLASGYPSNVGGSGGAPHDPELSFVPYIRDLESAARFGIGNDRGVTFGTATPRVNPGGVGNFPPFARLVRHGRTDLCAQNLEQVRRWLEGLEPTTVTRPTDASALDTGRYDINPPPVLIDLVPDAPLWQRVNQGVGQEQVTRAENLRGIRSAIAGTFTRILAESEPPVVDRRDSLAGGASTNLTGRDPPQSALMDLHAALASRCSDFQVAWSDGTTWLENTSYRKDTNGDGINDVTIDRGDVVWIDIDFMRDAPGSGNDLSDDGRSLLYPRPDPMDRTEVCPGQRGLLRLNPGEQAHYDLLATGAAEQPSEEYLSIWPFRTPDSSGGWLSPVGKPKLIRIRMTLHDSQFRVPGGRQYEFVFSLDLK